MWVMLGEMFPNQMRGSALALAAAAQWVANYADHGDIPGAGALSLALAYGFYAICAVVSFIFVGR